ncbi:MAG TPA: ribose-phosphate pyrophosphokinase [Verrucomicrobiae bacterium]|nr:ribose-phosphate pyrophosphokinase [Verrucomicrobiae bacterium]
MASIPKRYVRAVESSDNLKIFSGNANRPLAQRIADYVGVAVSNASISSFPDQETWVKINENIRGRDVFIVQPTSPPANQHLMELLIMIDACRRASAQRITAVIPFFGYARQDRKDQPRVPITAKLVANLITAAGANRVLTMDLHAQQIMGFFDIPVDHLYAAPVIYRHFKQKNLTNLVMVSPDIGGTKMVSAYANMFHAPLAIVAKKRKSASEVEVLNVVGDIEGHDVLMVDDLAETGGTLTRAAAVLKQKGAKRVFAAVSHAVLNPAALDRLKASDLEELVTTDTVSHSKIKEFKFTELTVAPLLGEAIKRIHDAESVSSLFDIDGERPEN